MTAKKRAEIEEAIQGRYAAGVSLDRITREYGLPRYVVREIITKGGGIIRGKGRPARVKAEPVLANKLKILAETLGEPVNDDVLRTIVLYAMKHNDGRTFRKIDRRYDYDGALSAFRRDHLESSYYFMGRLWRYAYRAVAKDKMIQFTDYGVAKEDAHLVMKVLAAEEQDVQSLLLSDSKDGKKARAAGTVSSKDRIRAWLVEAGEYVHLPNEECVHRIVQDCEKTMNTIVNSKLRFVWQYDPAFEKSDLVSYLRVIAYRVAMKYDWEMLDGAFNYVKCFNYTNRSMWNAATLLIKEVGDGGVHSRLTKMDTDERVYQVTTISMDTPQNDEWISIESKLGEEADTTVEVKDLISSITDQRLHDFLRLEHEEVPGFAEFVLKESGKDENELYTDDYDKWRQLAQHFAGLLTPEDRAPIKQAILTDMGMWDDKKMRA